MAGSTPYFLIAATKKSSGKTTLALGLTRAFVNRGLSVQNFKKGPDYIDPLWLAQASGNACYNLDFNTQSEAEILSTFAAPLPDNDLAIIETNKGLFDGVEMLGADSNAQLAKILKSPIVLVVDTIGMTRGIAPLLQGYANFDPDIKIAGLILNKTGGTRHEEKLRRAVEHYTDIPVLGALGRDDELGVNERHLGLTTPGEKSDADPLIELLAERVEKSIDLDAIHNLANAAEHTQPAAQQAVSISEANITIAIASDEAFGFYYFDDLENLQQAGVGLVFFSPLHDEKLPECDGLFIGGGFPETHMEKLEANASMREQIKTAIEGGLPTYAECGGLMYLARSIQYQDKSAQMVGVIPGDCQMQIKPQGRGFAKLQQTAAHPWGNIASEDKTELNAHEFHYSNITNLPTNTNYAYKITRGHGIDGDNDGIVIHNMLANFCHFRDTDKTRWVERFVEFVRENKG